MEYLTVQFPESRTVLINGEANGQTGEIIELEAGTQTVSLAPPDDFTPPSQTVVLQNTSPLSPHDVTFEKA